MNRMRGWAIVCDTERQLLTREIDIVTTRWATAPSPWKDHWDHLVTVAADWETDPQSMQHRLDRIASDYERSGTTDLASPIQIRNLLLAGELVESRRIDLGIAYDPYTPDRVDQTYGYLTSYRTAGNTTMWESLPSWSTARRWLRARAGDTDPRAFVDVTVTGPDPVTGAATRPLMTGTGLTAAELTDQLHRIDELLGTTPIPADPSAHSWLDELRYDVLCDAYRATLLEHRNPWSIGRRYEHHLHADDLRTEITDHTSRAGLHTAAPQPDGDEVPDLVEARLDDIRRSIGEHGPDWTIAPRASTWLDDAVTDAQRRLADMTTHGLALTYTDPTQPNQLTAIGFDGDRWYLQHAQTATDGRTITYDTPPRTYRTCNELLAAATAPDVATPQSPNPVTVPETIRQRLHELDNDLHALRHDLTCVRQLRDAVRTGTPYTLRRDHHPAVSSTRIPRHSGLSRDANHLNLTETPDSEKPTPAPEPTKPPRAKRRQQPKPGRQHRRRL